MTKFLPSAPWQQGPDLLALVAVLGQENARYVGGAVRDTLLGLAVSDIDLATPLLPNEVMARCDKAHIRTVPTGLEHGTVTAVLPQGAVEITTLRRDVSTDGRRATVAFTTDWPEDAARRDFTINALYADPDSGEIFDWFGGLADLEARRLRFIGNAEQRIREDHLRILRYFRFKARFGKNDTNSDGDPEAEQACASLAATLKGLSRERIGMEMLKLLSLPNPAPSLADMARLGVLGQILPEGDPSSLFRLVAEEQRQQVPPDPLRRLSALLPADPVMAGNVAARFRLSGMQKKRLIMAGERKPASGPAEINPRALAYRLGLDAAMDRLMLAGAEVQPLIGWTIPICPVKGGDIVAHGIQAGPDVARILRHIEDRWIEEGFPDHDRVREILEQETNI